MHGSESYEIKKKVFHEDENYGHAPNGSFAKSPLVHYSK
jgi:hypothetical protein